MERVLGFSRLFLALTALIAWLIRPVASGPYYHFGRFLLLAYIIHSLGLLMLLRIQRTPTRDFVVWSQISDILWPSLLCLFTDPPNSIFFVFFLFAMLAAAFRWGFTETMATAVISAGVLLFQAAIVRYGPSAVAAGDVHAAGSAPGRHALWFSFDHRVSPGFSRRG